MFANLNYRDLEIEEGGEGEPVEGKAAQEARASEDLASRLALEREGRMPEAEKEEKREAEEENAEIIRRFEMELVGGVDAGDQAAAAAAAQRGGAGVLPGQAGDRDKEVGPGD